LLEWGAGVLHYIKVGGGSCYMRGGVTLQTVPHRQCCQYNFMVEFGLDQWACIG
jgi:hypothetical protein